MAATPSVRVIKSFSFKGGSRKWSNRYHFNGGVPADSTHWHTLFDAVTAAEKACLKTNTTIVQALGYAAGSDVAVDSKVYSLAGTYPASGAEESAPGECAALIRWSTAAKSTKNHPIYLFSYFHGITWDASKPDADYLTPALKTALSTYATSWVSGFSDGTKTLVRASPQGAAATGSIVEEFITHRDFPYTTSV